MQCIAAGTAAHGKAIGPKAGTSITNIRNLAVQREAPHICGTLYQYSARSSQYLSEVMVLQFG